MVAMKIVANLSAAEKMAVMRLMGNTCPLCEGILDDHRYVQFARTIAKSGEDSRLRAFCKAFADRSWRELLEFKDFSPLENAAVVYAISCPDGGVEMIFVRDPFELFDVDTIEDRVALSRAECNLIQELVTKELWIAL